MRIFFLKNLFLKVDFAMLFLISSFGTLRIEIIHYTGRQTLVLQLIKRKTVYTGRQTLVLQLIKRKTVYTGRQTLVLQLFKRRTVYRTQNLGLAAY